jgi:MFS family permease
VRLGLSSMIAGTLVLIGGISPGAGAEIVTIPMLLMGLGIGALASQLGAITVSAVPDRESAEVGGLQNTVTNLGASLGTVLVGAVLIGSLTTGLVNGVQDSSAIRANVKTQATTQRTSLWVVALIAVAALFFTGLIPTEPVGRAKPQLATPDPAQATTS